LSLNQVKRHLVFDEVESFITKRGNTHRYRIRVWRAVNATPVVFVTPVEVGDERPDRYATLVANWVFQALLHCDPHGLLYFDACTFEGVAGVFQEFFGYVGHALRLRLLNPVSSKITIERLSAIVGEPVEL